MNVYGSESNLRARRCPDELPIVVLEVDGEHRPWMKSFGDAEGQRKTGQRWRKYSVSGMNQRTFALFFRNMGFFCICLETVHTTNHQAVLYAAGILCRFVSRRESQRTPRPARGRAASVKLGWTHYFSGYCKVLVESGTYEVLLA